MMKMSIFEGAHGNPVEMPKGEAAYDTFVAEAPKVGELYWAVVQDAYAPFERAVQRA